jgi:H/ACA ribonucleoprotein complex non-core subunit NAF1
MEDQPDIQMHLGEGQPQLKSEQPEASIPVSTTPIGASSDFYNTPLTGQTPIYPADSTSLASNESISESIDPTTSAPAIPGLSIQTEDGDKPAPPAEGQDTEISQANGDAVNGASDVAQPTISAQPVESAPTTDAMDTDQTAADQPMTTEEEHPEWEVDSSPYESSSDSSTDSSDSDESDEDEEDYPILSAEETARILMQAEGGSDDEGDNKTGGGSHLRTANEKLEEAPPIPDIKVTEDMKIVPLGHLESMVENLILIKATVSGDYQVLESNSLLCLEDRTVIGVVADTLGRVEEPLYTVRYQDSAKIQELGLEKGKHIFYVESHSEFVFTQPLKGMKGSDASNFHDEEVAEDEIEFSDDEAEAEYKRRLKQKKKEKKDNRGDGGKPKNAPGPSPLGRGELNYDDDGGDKAAEDGYTPLARPKNYHEMMNHPEAHTESAPSFQNNRGNFRGRGRGRGGFDRGSGRGRGNDRRGRGNYHNNYSQDSSHRSDYSRENPAPSQYQNYSAPSTAFSAQQYPQYPSYPQPHHQQQPQQQPQFPQFGQAQTTGIQQFPFQMPYQQNPYQQNTYQPNPYQNVPSGAHINPAFFAALQQQLQQQQPAAPPTPQNQATANNQATFNQVQDILRQLSGGGNVGNQRR